MPWAPYANKYYGIFLDGILARVVYVAGMEVVDAVCLYEGSSTKVSGYVEDFGQWPSVFDTQIPDGMARAQDAITAKRLSFKWDAPTTFSQANNYATDPVGDSQLSLITITGMKRFTNCQSIDGMPTRARLTYTITNISGTYYVRWFSNGRLMAEGSRAGNGSVTCAEQNDSNLEIVCTITFTGAVLPDVAYVDLIWPEKYGIHYSTSALSFPRTAEVNVDDIGLDNFGYITLEIASGTYEAAIVPVRDGIAQTASIATTTGLVISTSPAPPVLIAATGSWAALNINWTLGEAGCTYKTYVSKINEPINWGDYASPNVLGPTAVDAVTQAYITIPGTLPGIVRYCVRATKAGIQEQNGEEGYAEFDAAGALVLVRPNRASIWKISASGLTITVECVVLSLEKEVAATHIDLSVRSTDVFGVDAIGVLPAAVGGVQRVSIPFTVAGGGRYFVRAKARAANGSYSYDAEAENFTTNYSTLSAAIDAAVVALNTAYALSYAAFYAAYPEQQRVMQAAVTAYLLALGKPGFEFSASGGAFVSLKKLLDASTSSTYKADTRTAYQDWLQEIAVQLDGNPVRYSDELGGAAPSESAPPRSSLNLKMLLRGMLASEMRRVYLWSDVPGAASNIDIDVMRGRRG